MITLYYRGTDYVTYAPDKYHYIGISSVEVCTPSLSNGFNQPTFVLAKSEPSVPSIAIYNDSINNDIILIDQVVVYFNGAFYDGNPLYVCPYIQAPTGIPITRTISPGGYFSFYDGGSVTGQKYLFAPDITTRNVSLTGNANCIMRDTYNNPPTTRNNFNKLYKDETSTVDFSQIGTGSFKCGGTAPLQIMGQVKPVTRQTLIFGGVGYSQWNGYILQPDPLQAYMQNRFFNVELPTGEFQFGGELDNANILHDPTIP